MLVSWNVDQIFRKFRFRGLSENLSSTVDALDTARRNV